MKNSTLPWYTISVQARHFSRKKQLHFNWFWIFSFILFGCLFFFSFSTKVSAQTNFYNVFEKLFSPITEPAPKNIIGISSWIFDNQTNPTKVTGAVFTLSAKFDVQGTGKSAGWFWDHVADLRLYYGPFGYTNDNDIGNTFLLRICPKQDGIVNEQSCLFKRNFYDPTARQLSNFGINIPTTNLLSQEQLSSSSEGDKYLVPGESYQADVWYCSKDAENFDGTSINTARHPDIPNTNRIKDFGDICGDYHRAYFRVGYEDEGSVFSFIFPKNMTEVQNGEGTTTTAATLSDNSREEKEDVMPNCHILNGWGPGQGSFVGCIAYVVYYGIYWPASWFAGVMGNIFDFFLGFSLSDASYRLDFAVTGWKLIRDISNIFFIIILIYTGFAAVFDIGSVSMKKVVPALIINAFIINFSLFATRVVIDISNVFGRILYNTMNVTKITATGERVAANNSGPGGYKPLSEKIVSSLSPQKIFTPALLGPKQ